MTCGEIFKYIQSWAPEEIAWDQDNVGLQVGSAERKVKNILLALDLNMNVVEEAVKKDCNIIITHHPLLFNPLRKIDTDLDKTSRLVEKLIKHNITLFSAHTNLDFTKDGVSFELAKTIKLKNIRFLSIFKSIEKVDYGIGAIGELKDSMNQKEFLSYISNSLGITNFRYTKGKENKIKTVAVCGGSGSEIIPAAVKKGADAFITADIKYHTFFDNEEKILLIDAGHYETEIFSLGEVNKRLRKLIKTKKNKVFNYSGNTNPVLFYNKLGAKLN